MLDPVFAYLAGLLCLLCYLIYARKNKITKRRIMLVSVFILYMTAVAALTLFPMIYDRAYVTPGNNFENCIQIIPFYTIGNMIRYGIPAYAAIQIFGNLIMTIPFGAALPILIGNEVKRHRKPFFAVFAVILPLKIELTQLTLDIVLNTYYRTMDVDDIILNTAGVFIGYGLCVLMKKAYRYYNQKRLCEIICTK